VVVLTNTTVTQQLEINDYTHSAGIKFISADVRGLFASVFCDFGPQFPCIDATGEQPLQGMIVGIDQDENSKDAIVTTLDETRHGLEDGDYVTFAEVKGMTELNGCEPRKVTVKGESRLPICASRKLILCLSTHRSLHLLHRRYYWSVSLCFWRHLPASQNAKIDRFRLSPNTLPYPA
jgi:hypothetical protein